MADGPDRRRFLVLGGAALAGAGGLGGYVSLSFLQPWNTERSRGALVVGYPEDIPDGAALVFADERVMVGRTGEEFFALSTVCPHLGCVVRWLEGEERFHCPCHGSKFERQGRVLNGPAGEDLVALPIGLDDRGRVVVEPGEGPA